MLKSTPNHPYAHGLLGELWVQEGRYAEAEKEFSRSTTTNPAWVAAWLNYANLVYGQGKPEEGEKILRAGLVQNPTSEELRLILATKLGEANKINQAIQEYEAILQADHKSIVAANNLATLLADEKGDPASLARALALTREFENGAPHPFFLDTLGWVYLKLGRHKDGLRVLTKAFEKAPQHPLLNYHLGVAYHSSGDIEQAKIYLSKALTNNASFPGDKKAAELLQALQNS